MMHTYAIFVQHADITQIVSILATLTGLELTITQRETDQSCQFRTMGVEFSVTAPHGMVDDSGMEFSKYGCMIDLHGLRIGDGLDSYTEMLRAVSCFIGQLMSSRLDCDVLVARNLQAEVAQYGPNAPTNK